MRDLWVERHHGYLLDEHCYKESIDNALFSIFLEEHF